MAPKPPRKGIKSNRPPFYTSKGFVAAVVVVALSILLTLEPVANLVDDLLRQLTGHEKTRRSLSMTQAAEQLCKETNDCRAIASNAKFQVTVTNESPYRADIYYDNGGFGKQIATVEANGGKESLDVYRDNLFFVTRHGVKEGLFDPETEEQHKFITTMNGQTFVIPENARPSDNLCQDRFSVCSDYAKRGQCWDSPGWMIVHCCKSCDSVLDAGRLIDPNARCTKENLNITDPIWHPGDLHKLFTSWVTSESFSQYEPQVLSSPGGAHGGKEGPWVITFDNFFTEEEAQALIKGGAEAGFERSTNQGSVNALGEMEMVKSTTRTSSNAWCIGACQRIPQVRTVTARIEKVTDIPEKNYEPFQILEYQDNQFYKMHHVSCMHDHLSLSLSLALNNFGSSILL